MDNQAHGAGGKGPDRQDKESHTGGHLAGSFSANRVRREVDGPRGRDQTYDQQDQGPRHSPRSEKSEFRNPKTKSPAQRFLFPVSDFGFRTSDFAVRFVADADDDDGDVVRPAA